jgi:hypothetical protein
MTDLHDCERIRLCERQIGTDCRGALDEELNAFELLQVLQLRYV